MADHPVHLRRLPMVGLVAHIDFRHPARNAHSRVRFLGLQLRQYRSLNHDFHLGFLSRPV
jgi:hypothetical protein